MVDNVAVTPGSGATFATDDVGGIQYPRVKLAQGADGAATDVSSAAPLQVTLANGTVPSHAVTNAGTFATQAAQSGTWTVQPGNTANTTAWLAKIGDGTNTAAIKAASTAPVATDPALVVSMSPNSQNANGQTTMANSTPVTIASDQTALAVTPAGNVAHDAVDSGNPQKIGAKATTSLSGLTLVASADRTDMFAGVDGVIITRPYCNLEDIVSGRATDTAGTSTTCISAQAAGIKTYLTSVALTNSSATAVTVNILDGASVKYTLSVPAGSGNNKEFNVPLPGTAATAWNFQSSAAATTITCSMIGFKSKI